MTDPNNAMVPYKPLNNTNIYNVGVNHDNRGWCLFVKGIPYYRSELEQADDSVLEELISVIEKETGSFVGEHIFGLTAVEAILLKRKVRRLEQAIEKLTKQNQVD